MEMGSWFSRIFSIGWRIIVERGMVAVGGVAARTAMAVGGGVSKTSFDFSLSFFLLDDFVLPRTEWVGTFSFFRY